MYAFVFLDFFFIGPLLPSYSEIPPMEKQCYTLGEEMLNRGGKKIPFPQAFFRLTSRLKIFRGNGCMRDRKVLQKEIYVASVGQNFLCSPHRSGSTDRSIAFYQHHKEHYVLDCSYQLHQNLSANNPPPKKSEHYESKLRSIVTDSEL